MVELRRDKLEGSALLLSICQRALAGRDVKTSMPSLLQDPASFFGLALAGLNWQDGAPLDHELVTDLLAREDDLDAREEPLFLSVLDSLASRQDAAPRALLQVILRAAGEPCAPDLFFHYWLSEKLRSWLGPRGFSDPRGHGAVVELREHVQRMLALGINLRGRKPSEFLAARFAVAGESEADAWGVLDALVACASFSGAGLLETVGVLSFSPPEPTMTCAAFGLLAGRFYGAERLLRLETLGSPLQRFVLVEKMDGGSAHDHGEELS